MDPFSMVVAIVFMSLVTGTIHKYLETRASMTRAHGAGTDRGALRAVEELRAEIAAMKQREAEAILTFDTTLQNMDARLKHLERASLAPGHSAPSSLAAGAPRPVEEPEQVNVGQAA